VETPFEIVLAIPGLRLRRYLGASAGPPLLIVPAPIKRPYIFDLAPRASVVRRCLAAGFRVFLAEWVRPDLAAATFGLADYADRLIAASLDRIAADCGAVPIALIGHSLGGTFGAIFSALNPDHLAALVLLEAPLRFGRHAGAFAPLIEVAPEAAQLTAALGNIPGSFLDLVSVGSAPLTFVWSRWIDRLLSAADSEATATHWRVERWSLDEASLPARLFEEVVELLYREDQFMGGRLVVAGRRAGPKQITVPLLAVFNPGSTIVPAGSIVPFVAASASREKQLLHYGGDRGTSLQHVGVLVGKRAHRLLWPEILDWIKARGGS